MHQYSGLGKIDRGGSDTGEREREKKLKCVVKSCAAVVKMSVEGKEDRKKLKKTADGSDVEKDGRC